MRRSYFGLVGVLCVLVAIVASAHYYIALRLVHDTGLPHPFAELTKSAIAFGLVLLVAQPICDRVFGPSLGRILGWPAYLWLGTCFYLLLGLWASDFALLVFGLHGQQVARARAIMLCAGVLFTVAAGTRAALRPPAVKRIEIRIHGWPSALDGYRIIQISDIHVGSLIGRAFAERLVRRCNALTADLIAITGDLVDGSVQRLQDKVVPFGELRARDGVYFVTGNHDYYSGADSWVKKLGELGIEVLRNRRIALERDGTGFELAGVDDLSSRRMDSSHGHDLDAALAGWLVQTPLVLLAHDPRTFDQARGRGVHLQLSGHTHGGQLWPFRWFVRLQTRYVAGLYQHDRSQLYVSRGTGYWGPPIRVLAPAEITDIVLRAGSAPQLAVAASV